MSLEKDLAQQAYGKMKTGLWRQYRWPVFTLLLLLILMFGLVVYFWHQRSQSEDLRLQQAKVLSEQYAKDVNALQNELKMSKQNAEMLAAFMAKAQTGQVQPVTNFTVQASTLPQAVQQIAERINNNDPTLPPVALEKTDRTVVIPNENKTPQANYDVGVFKVNNYRNWEWSAGYGQHGGDKYVPVEVQRNFSKNAAVSYEQHVGGKQSGWEAKYTIKTDNLFGLF